MRLRSQQEERKKDVLCRWEGRDDVRDRERETEIILIYQVYLIVTIGCITQLYTIVAIVALWLLMYPDIGYGSFGFSVYTDYW